MDRAEKKQIVVGKLGESLLFTVKNKNGDVLFECYEPVKRWGIDRCANWIRQYNSSIEEEKEEKEEKDAESE